GGGSGCGRRRGAERGRGRCRQRCSTAAPPARPGRRRAAAALLSVSDTEKGDVEIRGDRGIRFQKEYPLHLLLSPHPPFRYPKSGEAARQRSGTGGGGGGRGLS